MQPEKTEEVKIFRTVAELNLNDSSTQFNCYISTKIWVACIKWPPIWY